MIEGAIDNKDRFFKGQMSDENYILFFRKHWLYLLPTVLLFLGICVLTVVFFSIILMVELKQINAGFYRFLIAILSIGFVSYAHWFFLKLFGYFLTVCILSDYRLLALNKSVYTKDSKETADLGMIQDIKKDQSGIIRNFLKYGNIIITFSSSSTIMILSDAPNVEFHFRALVRARQAFVERRIHQPIKPPERPPETNIPRFAEEIKPIEEYTDNVK